MTTKKTNQLLLLAESDIFQKSWAKSSRPFQEEEHDENVRKSKVRPTGSEWKTTTCGKTKNATFRPHRAEA